MPVYSCKGCEEIPWLKEALGHDGPPGEGGDYVPLWDRNMLTDEPIKLCPIRALQLAPDELRAEVTRMQFELYPLFEKGPLLVKGAVSDQPARYLAYMQEISELTARIKAKLTESVQEQARSEQRAAARATGRGSFPIEQEE